MRTIGQNGKYYLADEADAEIVELKKALSIAFDMIPNPPETQGQEYLVKLIVKLLDS